MTVVLRRFLRCVWRLATDWTCPSAWTPPSLVFLSLVFSIAMFTNVVIPQTGYGQEPNSEDVPSEESDAVVPESESKEILQSLRTLPLPLQDQNGRPIRPIGFYLSQIMHIVPRDYRPISIQALQKALGNSTQSPQNTPTTNARLVSGFYDIRVDKRLLVSNHSELVVEHPAQWTRRDLGQVNLALSESSTGSLADLPGIVAPQAHLEIDHQGSLIAEIPLKETAPTPDPPTPDPADQSRKLSTATEDTWLQSEIPFAWTLRGHSFQNITQFELQIPRTSQTRLVISTPRDTILESKQGVLTERPGPPPGADIEMRTGDIRWYVLDAGGLRRIELFARQLSEPDESQPLLVRRDSRQYEVDLSGVSWVHRMTLEMPLRRSKLSLSLPDGTITDVRVNLAQTNYQIVEQNEGPNRIEITLPENEGRLIDSLTKAKGETAGTKSEIDLVTLTVEGSTTWELSDGTCPLPSVIPLDADILWTESMTQAFVTLVGPLSVASWDLPESWTQSILPPTQIDETVLSAEGPPQQLSRNLTWSHLRLVAKKERYVDEVWTRLQVHQAPARQVDSISRIRFRLLQNQQSPLKLEFNPDWTLESVTVVGSGRRVASPASENELVIWPTAAESAQATLEIEVVAQQNATRGPRRSQLQPTWVVRPKNHVASHMISIQPPALRRWNGESVMLPERIPSISLDEEAVAFFQPTETTLMLRSLDGEIPAVELEPIDVSFGVNLRQLITTVGEEVSETIIVRTDTTQPIPSLSVLTGNTADSEFSWSLRRTDQSATISLPRSSIQRRPNDILGTYEIELDGRDLRQYELVGQRYFTPEEEFTLSLPSVRRARNQTGEVSFDATWEVSELSPGVQLVPGTGGTQSSELPGKYFQYLRYDPGPRPVVKVRRSSDETAACLIWNQHYDALVHCRSEDRLQIAAEISSRTPVRVTYDSTLELIGVRRNGTEYRPTRTGPGELWIDPERQSDQIAVSLRRRHSSDQWFRRCRIPNVSIDGQVIHHSTSIQSGPSSVILFQRTLIEETPPLNPRLRILTEQTSDFAAPTDIAELILAPRNFMVALGWLLAASLVCISWSMARFLSLGLQAIFVLVALSISAAILCWPWQLAIIGWVTIPLITGGLLQLTCPHHIGRISKNRRSQSPHLDDTRSQTEDRAPEVDFSISVPRTSILFAIAISAALAGIASAQISSAPRNLRDQPGESLQTSDPIELLVPLDETHQPVGNKVYLSGADFASVQSASDPSRATDVRFSRAEYRVVLSSQVDAMGLIGAEIQGEYRIHLDRPSSRIRLPFKPISLKRIELLSDSAPLILRSIADSNGMVIVTIPTANQVRLRVTFNPTIAATRSFSEPDNLNDQATNDFGASTNRNGSTIGVSPLDSDELGAQDVNNSRNSAFSRIRLNIPRVHSARLFVETPADIQVESLGVPNGRTLFRSELGRYECDLGPTDELNLVCRPARPNTFTPQNQFRRAYRITAGPETTVVECEITPEQRIAMGDAVQLTILGAAPNNVTSASWTMESNGTSESTDRQTVTNSNAAGGVYRFTKRDDIESPIRLLWQLPSHLNDPTSTDDSEVMPIPEVFASTSSRSIPTIVAIQSSKAIKVTELSNNSKPISTDAFYASWLGYPGPIERAFLIEDTFPSFLLLQDKQPLPTTTLTHELHVAPTHMEMRLRAKIVDPISSVRRLRIAVPHPFKVVRSTINGESNQSFTSLVESSPQSTHPVELVLGDRRRNGITDLQIVAESIVPVTGQWELPRFILKPSFDVQHQYLITRDRSLTVELANPGTAEMATDAPPTKPNHWTRPELSPTSLLAGRIPVLQTTHTDGAMIRVARKPWRTVFECRQLTLMRYADGQWFCDTIVDIPMQRSPDYVDVEIPTRWANDLNVDGSSVWSTRQSVDGLATIVRIAPQTDQDRNNQQRRLRITSSLDNRDQTLVSVPEINVLGQGKRDRFIAVPKQLTQESVTWRTESVVQVPGNSPVMKQQLDLLGTPDRYTLYIPSENKWSVELEPLRQATERPVVLSCDARVFMEGQRVLILQRFDLLPETLNQVTAQFPVHAKCIGIWSAGREIDLRELHAIQSTRTTQSSDQLRPIDFAVPLSYSRLPQSLEILFEVPVVDHKITDYLCNLAEISSPEIWTSYYRVPDVSRDRQLTVMIAPDSSQQQSDAELADMTKQRGTALAQGVVNAVLGSRDMIAERSDDEIKRWLLPWIARYKTIASQNGHSFRLTTSENNVVPVANEEQSESIRWQSYDQQLLQIAGRFLQSDPELPKPLFTPSRFSEFALVSIVRVEPETQPPSLGQSFTQRESLHSLLLNVITLLTFGLAIIMLWPFRGRFEHWIREPALWLFLIGLASCFLAPMPLAMTIMITAMTLPLINWLKNRYLPSI